MASMQWRYESKAHCAVPKCGRLSRISVPILTIWLFLLLPAAMVSGQTLSHWTAQPPFFQPSMATQKTVGTVFGEDNTNVVTTTSPVAPGSTIILQFSIGYVAHSDYVTITIHDSQYLHPENPQPQTISAQTNPLGNPQITSSQIHVDSKTPPGQYTITFDYCSSQLNEFGWCTFAYYSGTYSFQVQVSG